MSVINSKYSALLLIFGLSNAHDVANCRYVTIPVCGEQETAPVLTRNSNKGQKGEVGSPGKHGPKGPLGHQGAKGGIGPRGWKGEPSNMLDVESLINRKLEEFKSEMVAQTAVDLCRKSNRSGIHSFYGHDYVCDGKGWTIIQHRQDGAVDFERNWNEYSNGFGKLEGEFWIGLKTLHKLTRNRSCRLRFDMESFDQEKAFAEYNSFSVSDEENKFQLLISGYSGTAGESMIGFHNGMYFTTKDKDNDSHGTNCAPTHGGWWFKNCFRASPNGQWGRSTGQWTKILWFAWKGESEALQKITMKIRCT